MANVTFPTKLTIEAFVARSYKENTIYYTNDIYLYEEAHKRGLQVMYKSYLMTNGGN
jgi:hypothetical protein